MPEFRCLHESECVHRDHSSNARSAGIILRGRRCEADEMMLFAYSAAEEERDDIDVSPQT